MERYQHYINGQWTDPTSGEWFLSENPYTGKPWAEIARGSAKDINKAVASAKAAFAEVTALSISCADPRAISAHGSPV